jgi:hypothetical protein
MALAVVAISCPVYADEDPFQMESTHWMSFDRYKEKIKKGDTSSTSDASENNSSVENISTPGDTAHDAKGDAAPITPPVLAATVAAPTRPINIPVMPGINKGYDVKVNSTEDERPPIAHITNIDTQPTVAIPEKNWQTPHAAAQHPNQENADGTEDNEHTPLDVRMSFLPNTKIAPIPSPEYKSNHGRKASEVAAASAPPEPEKKASDPAACAAIDAYKKKQLAAIESDRQTLTELQKAISQLGLQKELSFMTGANGNMNQADSSQVKIDMPPSLAAPSKN